MRVVLMDFVYSAEKEQQIREYLRRRGIEYDGPIRIYAGHPLIELTPEQYRTLKRSFEFGRVIRCIKWRDEVMLGEDLVKNFCSADFRSCPFFNYDARAEIEKRVFWEYVTEQLKKRQR